MPTFEELAASAQSGDLVELYHFFRGAQEWNLTTDAVPHIYNSDTYTPTAIIHGDLEAGSPDNPFSLDVHLPTSHDLGLEFQAGTPANPVSLTIFAFNRDNPEDVVISFMGEVDFGDFEGDIGLLHVASLLSGLEHPFPRGLVQEERCTWPTFQPETCGVDVAVYTFAGTVAAITGLDVTVTGAEAFGDATSGQPDPDFFNGGIFRFGNRIVGIRDQLGDVITLVKPIAGLAISSSISITAGDDHSPFVCHNRFHNKDRRVAFGGIPQVSPFFGQGLNQG